MLQVWDAGHRDHGLRHLAGERAEAGAQSAGQDYGLHTDLWGELRSPWVMVCSVAGGFERGFDGSRDGFFGVVTRAPAKPVDGCCIQAEARHVAQPAAFAAGVFKPHA